MGQVYGDYVGLQNDEIADEDEEAFIESDDEESTSNSTGTSNDATMLHPDSSDDDSSFGDVPVIETDHILESNPGPCPVDNYLDEIYAQANQEDPAGYRMGLSQCMLTELQWNGELPIVEGN